MTTPAFLAGDWGTTNLRAWLSTADGAPLESREFTGLGVSRLAPGEAAQRYADEVRPAFKAENLPAVLCGMIGSDLGLAPGGLHGLPGQRRRSGRRPDHRRERRQSGVDRAWPEV